MVTLRSKKLRKQGWLVTEVVLGLGILVLTILPVSLSFWQEQRMARLYYQKAIAMEIVDGEAEILMAGEWQNYPLGSHSYKPVAASMTNLPPGKFMLERMEKSFRLTWVPQAKHKGGELVREGAIP